MYCRKTLIKNEKMPILKKTKETAMIKIAMFDSKQYDMTGFDKYKTSDMKIKYFESKLTEDSAALASGYDAVVVFVNDIVNRTVIEKLKSAGVKLIALRCAGFNNVDLSAAEDNQIKVVRVPAYSPHAVAEHAMALLLTSIRRTHKAYNRTRDFNFTLDGLVGFDLYGKTAGIIGTGKIGKIFIEICKGFGMKTIASDPYPDESADIAYVSNDELFAMSDIISLHCPLTPDTHHIIDANAIGKMKKGTVIINTSRGALIDTEALINGIKEKKIGAACLDVYEEEAEWFFKDYSSHIVQDDTLARLVSMPNVILTSHQGFLTEEALNNIAKTTLDNIGSFLNDGTLKNEVTL